MVMTMAWMMPARAQHPFTLTTASDITNGTQHYYLIQSIDRPTFYAIPHSNADGAKVSTTSIPNTDMRWCFVDAGSDSDHQYYYIVNSTDRCLYRYGGGNDEIQIKNTYTELSSLSDAELTKYKFYLTQTESDYYIQPKGFPGQYLNKRGGNIQYTSGYYIKSSTYNDPPSVWNFIAEGNVTWTQPFTISTNDEKHYYKLQNVTNTSFCLSNNEEWATVSSTGSNKNVWYFLDAGTDATYSNCHYYYIVNASTEKYLYYTGGTGNDVAKIMDYNSAEADKYRFLIVDAAYKPDNTNYETGYTIVPKLRQAYFYDKDSFAPMAMSDDSHLLLKSDRGSSNYDSHWDIVATVYYAVEAPAITNNYDGTISMSTTTPNATIYYTTNGDTPNYSSTEYSSAFSLDDATVIKAIAYNSDLSESSSVTIYKVPKFTKPTIRFDDNTSLVTITSEGTVYYNTGDGSQAVPTPSTGTLYSTPFAVSVSPSTTVKAIATHAGYLNSYVATWSTDQGHDYSQDYLTFNVLTSGTICWKAFGSISSKAIESKTIEYKINDGEWTSIASTSDGVTFSVETDDVVIFKGSNQTYATDNRNYSAFNGGTATYDISGNIMSLIYGDEFIAETTMSGTYNFCSLFRQSRAVSAENLILPATSLTENCYRSMFSKCYTLEKAPALPATTLATDCYNYMFEECAIASAPELPATALVSNCYRNMFTGCTSLNYIKCLAVNKSASGCLTNWVKSVSPTGTFVKDENVNWTTGASGIPSGWDVNKLPDPVITCDGGCIMITCQTYRASIYYRLGQNGDYSLYSAPIAINGNTVVEAFAEKDELQSDIVRENCNTFKSYKFAGMKMAPGPLYYGSNGYEIKDGWNYDSYNSVYGKTVGSTHFNFIELGQLFESSVFSASDGDIEKVLDPLDGWRVPTNAEWASILGTTRSGSTVNESSNKHYAMIQLTGVTHAGSSTPSGLLIFPDGETITGVALFNMDNTSTNTGITESDLDNYLSQGCIFLPGSGCYDGSIHTWGNGHHYWSSIENNSSTGFDLYFEPSNTISSVDSKSKETYYFPIYLVKSAADEATRLLSIWKYKGNEVELPYSVNAIDGHSGKYERNTFDFTTDVMVKEEQPTYLWFQHADQSADIFVNSKKVETHWGGYNAFFTDITDAITPGINNIRVTLNNTSRDILAPYDGDFNFNATLGEVKLISSPVVPAPNYGYDGFHITSTVTAEEATITVKTSVPTSATLTCSIKGTNCNYSNTQTGTGEITFETTITNPHLWNGTLDPYLYDVTLTIAKDGVVYHTFKRGYGLRFYEYVINETVAGSSYTGFLLNGSPCFLRGVCMHNDLEGKANALTAADIDNDFEILKELGCNFVRLAHYPHPKEVYDRCDKMGLIVQTEVPWVNKSESTLPSDYYTHLEGQYDDMVNQHFNHPCILFWGLANEIRPSTKAFTKAKIEQYAAQIKALDSERLVGFVMSHTYDSPTYFDTPNVDWFGCNIYVGWYVDTNTNNPTAQLNARMTNFITNKNKPFAFSEYGCGGTQNCHSDDFLTTTTKGTSTQSIECYRHDIEYQMWLHEGHIAAINNFPQLLFTSQWQLFDVAVYNRHEGYTICLDGENTSTDDNLKYLNNKGLVERDHKTKKDPFYLYKALWNQTDKFVHICGKDYEKVIDRVIKCYTNDGNTLTLYVNDNEIETVAVANNIATFTATDFHLGDVIRVNGATSNDTFTFDFPNVFKTDGNWNVAANWSGNAIPADGNDATIKAECTIPNEVVAQANNITIGENGILTIANGGQLVTNNAVAATVKKTVVGSTAKTENNYYTISSPVNGQEIEDFVEAQGGVAHNIYRYDAANIQWQDYRIDNEGNYNFESFTNGQGYLFRTLFNGDVTYSGEINVADQTFTLSYDPDDELKSFNLIGNPFAHNIYKNDNYQAEGVKPAINSNYLATGYYRLNGGETWVPTIGYNNPILPGEGVLVLAKGGNGSSLNITNSTNPAASYSGGVGAKSGNDNLMFTVENSEYSDVTYAVFHKGYGLNKINHRSNLAPMIYIPQNNEDFAIAMMDDDTKAFSLNFEAKTAGKYTLSFKASGEFNYLHVIDRMTGDDIDMLIEGEYSFIGSPMDNPARFIVRLGYLPNYDDNGEDIFAYQNGTDIVVSGEGELQIFDVIGRMVSAQRVNGVETINLNAQGVYIFKLNGMTQKIVVR